MLHVYLDDNPLAKHDMRGIFTGNSYIHGCRILAIVTSVQRKTNKKGRPYAIVEIININNHIDRFFVFSNKYSEIDIKEGNYVLYLESFQDKWCITGAKKC